MSFSSYGLIVHDRRPESMRAGRVYVTLVVAGEMLLYSAIVLAVTSAGSAASATRAAPAAGPPDRLVAALFLAGFGIKAGMVPLHVWLPLAHPVAPTPASAVLSGAMIKAGLLGWLRFLPLGEAAHPGLGGVCVVLGFTSAFYGALVGLTQRDPKTVLAYSSVSQMGLMTLPVGVALVSPAHAGPALSAVVLFALHHALAKGSLFLGVGLAAVPPASRAGRALLGLGLVFPALALAGPTLTSGAVAKAGLKTALAASGMGGDLAISLLSAATVGTTLLMARYLVLVWPRAAEGAHRRAAGPGMSLPFAALVAAVAAAVWLVPWGDLRGAVRASAEVAPKWEVLWPVLAGTALAVPALRSGLPRAPGIPPGDLVVPAARGLARLGAGWLRLVGAIERALEAGRSRLIEPAARAVRAAIASGAGLEQALLRWEVGAVAFLIVSLALLASLALC
jgi:formate hydrogenlyase subunit 3/multisubunit Na+/H+ antiporter MnhD subunit